MNTLPERTSSVLQPAFFPNNTSEAKLSPTKHNLQVSSWNLQQKWNNTFIYKCKECWYHLLFFNVQHYLFSKKKSIINVDGFPTTIDSCWVCYHGTWTWIWSWSMQPKISYNKHTKKNLFGKFAQQKET